MAIRKVCVIGSGTMGNGIAQVCAQAGYETTMVDVKQEFLDRGMNMIRSSLGKFVQKEGYHNHQKEERYQSKVGKSKYESNSNY